MSENAVNEIVEVMPQAQRSEVKNSKLQKACRDFEGLLTGIILKQGMNPGINDEDRETGINVMRDFALENTARQMGQMGVFGIGDMMYEQLSNGGHK